jgi:hypothetical protein
MKKTIITFLLLIVVCSTSFGNDYITKSKQLGIVSYLTTIKSLAEHKMISLASDTQYTKQPGEAAMFRSHYNILKLSIDRLINQLSIDMIDKNSNKKYRKLNKYLKGEQKELPENLSKYKELLEEIDGQIESFMMRTFSSMMAGPEFSDILSGVELVHTAITDARDFREKKVQSIIGIITNLKLEKIKDLTENKKAE